MLLRPPQRFTFNIVGGKEAHGPDHMTDLQQHPLAVPAFMNAAMKSEQRNQARGP